MSGALRSQYLDVTVLGPPTAGGDIAAPGLKCPQGQAQAARPTRLRFWVHSPGQWTRQPPSRAGRWVCIWRQSRGRWLGKLSLWPASQHRSDLRRPQRSWAAGGRLGRPRSPSADSAAEPRAQPLGQECPVCREPAPEILPPGSPSWDTWTAPLGPGGVEWKWETRLGAEGRGSSASLTQRLPSLPTTGAGAQVILSKLKESGFML